MHFLSKEDGWFSFSQKREWSVVFCQKHMVGWLLLKKKGNRRFFFFKKKVNGCFVSTKEEWLVVVGSQKREFVRCFCFPETRKLVVSCSHFSFQKKGLLYVSLK